MKEASELEFLRWFYAECDFGPAHEDVVSTLMESFEKSKKKRVPKPYRIDYEDVLDD